jgi:protein TonB
VELLAPAPPNVPAPEISIEDAPVVALTDDPMLEAAIPSAAESGAGQQSAAGNAGDGNGSGTDVFAKCTNRVMPIFPIDAKVRNEQGRVVLLVELDERGRFASIEVARSSGSRSLDAAGIAAIKRWKCSPVYEHGRPVRVFAKQEFEFTLR